MQLVAIFQHVCDCSVTYSLFLQNMTLKTEKEHREYCMHRRKLREKVGGGVAGIIIARHQIILWHGPP